MTNGWMPGVEDRPTAAYGYGGAKNAAVGVMSHIMQGYQTTMLAWADERPPQRMASSHFSINRAGHIAQHVSIYDPSWHAGNVNAPTWPLYRGGNPNLYTVSIEHEGFAIIPNYGYDYVYDETHPWPDAMVEASIAVHRWVFDQLNLEPNEATVCGHFETDALNRPHDPGPAWPRGYIIRALTPAQGAPVELPPTLAS